MSCFDGCVTVVKCLQMFADIIIHECKHFSDSASILLAVIVVSYGDKQTSQAAVAT